MANNMAATAAPCAEMPSSTPSCDARSQVSPAMISTLIAVNGRKTCFGVVPCVVRTEEAVEDEDDDWF